VRLKLYFVYFRMARTPFSHTRRRCQSQLKARSYMYIHAKMNPAKKRKILTTDVMIDIETLSTEKNAAIVSIAAIKFNPWEPTEETTCEIFVDIEDCKSHGCDVSESTLEWWKKQPGAVYKHNFESGPRCTLKVACEKLNEFVAGCSRYWAQGVNFDPVILESAFAKSEVQPAWKFWQWRDVRTVQKMGSYAPSAKNDHNPLSDCRNQIAVVKRVFNELGVKNC
jgi:hypothetical protein